MNSFQQMWAIQRGGGGRVDVLCTVHLRHMHMYVCMYSCDEQEILAGLANTLNRLEHSLKSERCSVSPIVKLLCHV